MGMEATARGTLGLLLVFSSMGAEVGASEPLSSISITRHHKGDTFVAQDTKCYEDLCLGTSSGTASSTDPTGCHCQCMPNLPVFRDDLHICVDDIQECTLAPFLSGTTTQKVPYVFLPLKGQIVYPSAEIIVSEVATPICVVSGAQFLGRRGWIQLRNNSDTELPFRLFRDEGRTHLQWLGEGDLRLAMEGRLILVHLMCKDASGQEEQKIFTPCIAFRVAGNPSAGIREMMFATDRSASREGDRSLSVSEYIAIGVCILLLGLIYVASIFLYIYFRRKKKGKRKTEDGARLTVAEEGIVKSNPLLQATRRHLVAVAGQDNAGYASDSGSCCSESDKCSDIVLPEEEGGTNHQNVEIAAMVHPCSLECSVTETLLNQDSSSIEKLPEEDVSIVETIEGKEERPEMVRSMGSANVRKKLYFNPAYFELDMLKAPPPAALEFLTKIREVIAIAKHKMSAKRFSPSLIGIPEEEYYSRGGKGSAFGGRSRPASAVSSTGSSDSKRNRKASSCLGCAENEARDLEATFDLVQTRPCCPNETKQRIIRKWLEDVPFVKSPKQEEQMPPADGPQKTDAAVAGKEDPGRSNGGPPAPPQRKEAKKSAKGPAPPRPPPLPPTVPAGERPKGDGDLPGKAERRKAPGSTRVECPVPPTASGREESRTTKLPPPPPPTLGTVDKTEQPPSLPGRQEEEENVPRVQGKDKVPPVVAKTLMDAVIQELIVQRKSDKPAVQVSGVQNLIKKSLKPDLDMIQVKNTMNEKFHNADRTFFDVDSLERKSEGLEDDATAKKKMSEPEDGTEEERKEGRPEQIDSRIEVYDGPVLSGKEEATELREQMGEKRNPQDDHDYEVILLNPTEPIGNGIDKEKEKELKIYNLPEILSKNERSEGYSLVSEVYVNDGYSYSSDASTQSNGSDEGGRGLSRSPQGEKPGRLTIHVKDSPDNYRHVPDESDSFEPDTLDRKPGKFRYSKSIGNWERSVHDQYSNQRFHEMELECQHGGGTARSGSGNNESYVDSLERPRISLSTSGSFRRNSLERDVNELFANLNPPLARHFGSLREIYEAKSRRHRRRGETSSLVGSVPSDVECTSTLSWSEDRRNKLLHRGIVLHVGEEARKPRRHRPRPPRANFPDVVPPRPPKPSSLSVTPNGASGASTPARSHCPSPACASPPPRSNCASPRPAAIHFPPPPPPPPPRITGCASPPPPPSRSICSSPTFCSGRASPARVGCVTPQPPPRSLCSSPISHRERGSAAAYVPPPPRVTSGTKPTPPSPSRSACASPVRSPRASPVPPPRPPTRSANASPPLPPRSTKPPLPPKNGRSSRQRKPGSEPVHGRHSSSMARRPLPPIPSPRLYHDSTLSSISSRDPETLSTVSGASVDSLNSSDYEAFYTLPYDGHEGEIFDKAHRRLPDLHKNLKVFASAGTPTFYPGEEDGPRDEGGRRPRPEDRPEVGSWRKPPPKGERRFPHRLEDSGYLSTDSESGRRHRAAAGNGADAAGSQGSETEESLCDGASESGAESIATDSFFFGNFNGTKTSGSLDSGVGSEVNKTFLRAFAPGEADANKATEARDVFISVRQ